MLYDELQWKVEKALKHEKKIYIFFNKFKLKRKLWSIQIIFFSPLYLLHDCKILTKENYMCDFLTHVSQVNLANCCSSVLLNIFLQGVCVSSFKISSNLCCSCILKAHHRKSESNTEKKLNLKQLWLALISSRKFNSYDDEKKANNV